MVGASRPRLERRAGSPWLPAFRARSQRRPGGRRERSVPLEVCCRERGPPAEGGARQLGRHVVARTLAGGMAHRQFRWFDRIRPPTIASVRLCATNVVHPSRDNSLFQAHLGQLAAWGRGRLARDNRAELAVSRPINVASDLPHIGCIPRRFVTISRVRDQTATKPEKRTGPATLPGQFPFTLRRFLVRPAGLEPAASCSGGKRSIR